jgi:FKBP-type peptidyl-prolyl cis-trans isomerase 2
MSGKTGVRRGDRIVIEYEGRLADGTIFDSATSDDPAVLDIGSGNVMLGIEKGVLGMVEEEVRFLHISPADGFGPEDPSLIVDIPLDAVPTEGREDGRVLLLKMKGGLGVRAKVIDVSEDFVRVDLNHPLRGKTLYYEIRLVSNEGTWIRGEGENY